jgi:hypothetical protein
MKKVFLYHTVLVLAAISIFVYPVQGQDDAKMEAQQLTDLMKAELRLTPEQYGKVFEANQRAVKKINLALLEKPDSVGIFTKSIEKVIDEMDVALLEILNGDQWNKWLDFSLTVIEQIKTNAHEKLQRSRGNSGKDW